jgi:phenylpyruvate tautomerase PptA (4-oxalocrotonate tautomerase family)
MPLYEVQHSYPLTTKQRQQIAESITHLHSTTFLTPSIFVHVKFHANDASDNTYFLAGKPRTTSVNRIIAMVRTSEGRTKKHWDELAARIENAWYNAVSGEVISEGKDEGKRKEEVNDADSKKQAKKLVIVAFYSMVGARENGHTIPTVS